MKFGNTFLNGDLTKIQIVFPYREILPENLFIDLSNI